MRPRDTREWQHDKHLRAARASLVGLVALLLGVMDISVARAQMNPELEAGYWAGMMCSAVFIAGRSPEDVIREELDGLAVPGDGSVAPPVVDRIARAVTVAYVGSEIPRMAVFREGWGSVLLPPGSTLDDVNALPNAQVRAPMPARDATQIPWPKRARNRYRRPTRPRRPCASRARESGPSFRRTARLALEIHRQTGSRAHRLCLRRTHDLAAH